MTTKVTVTTHSWPVMVSSFPLHARVPLDDGEWTELGIVEPQGTREFYIHDGQDLLIHELPEPEGS